MSIGVTFTVNNRPEFFEQTLKSWSVARALDQVKFTFSLEPNDKTQINAFLINQFFPEATIAYNEKPYGVLHNPYAALSRAFEDSDYAVLAEDDLLVSTDIVEYHLWASETYKDDSDIALICSFSPWAATKPLLPSVTRQPNFASVLIWGTWKDRWQEYIEPTWDHDYSTGTGVEKGWDWNLNKRVLPSLGKHCIQPIISRAQNIGSYGTHSIEGSDYVTAPMFEIDKPKCDYVEIGSA